MRILHNKKLICFVLFFIFSSFDNVLAADDDLQHFGVSAACGVGLETYLHYKTELETPYRIFFSTIFCTMPGLAKEIIDSTQEHNKFSGSDLAADIAGAIAGTVISSIINDFIQVGIDTGKEKRITLSLIYNF